MIIVVKTNLQDREVKNLVDWIEEKNVKVKATEGERQTILGLIGDTSVIDIDAVKTFGVVEDVLRVQEPYKQAGRKFHPDDTVIDIGGIRIGGGNFQVIAGPCSVESKEQITEIAQAVQRSGARLLRGGAFKPRTSPYAFQGLRATGIEYLLEAKKMTGMPIVTEIMSIDHLPLFEQVDVIQVGARNMQNFELLKELGKTNKVILLKRGLSNTVDELLMSAEYIFAGGNSKIILCERGIRTFETATRNTLDISCVPVLKKKTHLPILIDPSHSAGYSEYVEALSLAACAAGADGLIIEVHNNPKCALCDGAQSLDIPQFDTLMKKLNPMKKLLTDMTITQESLPQETAFYEEIVANVKPLQFQKGAKVACQGTDGAYSELCAEKVFAAPGIQFCKTFEDVFQAVSEERADYGVLPIENTIAGLVPEVYDLLKKYSLSIVAEKVLKIEHLLLSKHKLTEKEIVKVFSHPQALYQCKNFLAGLKNAELVSVSNTAVAAETASKGEKGVCAVASGDCVKKYGLSVVRENISDVEKNYTRFIVVGREMQVAEKADKISLSVILEHKQNALSGLLNLFSSENINMLKIESRPIESRPFEMMFYIDIEGNLKNAQISRMLSKIHRAARSVRVLGSYQKDTVLV